MRNWEKCKGRETRKKLGALRDELLNGETFYTLQEAKVLIECWRQGRVKAYWLEASGLVP